MTCSHATKCVSLCGIPMRIVARAEYVRYSRPKVRGQIDSLLDEETIEIEEDEEVTTWLKDALQATLWVFSRFRTRGPTTFQTSLSLRPNTPRACQASLSHVFTSSSWLSFSLGGGSMFVLSCDYFRGCIFVLRPLGLKDQ